MDIDMSCRMCAGIADPGVSLLDPSQQRLAKWVANNLNMEINADDGFPTRICMPCIEGIRNWMTFRDRCRKAHRVFCQHVKPRQQAAPLPIPPEQPAIEASPKNSAALTSPPSGKINTTRSVAGPSTSSSTLSSMEVVHSNPDSTDTIVSPLPGMRAAKTMLDKWLKPNSLQTEKQKTPQEKRPEIPKKSKNDIETLVVIPPTLKQPKQEKINTIDLLRQARIRPVATNNEQPPRKMLRIEDNSTPIRSTSAMSNRSNSSIISISSSVSTSSTSSKQSEKKRTEALEKSLIAKYNLKSFDIRLTRLSKETLRILKQQSYIIYDPKQNETQFNAVQSTSIVKETEVQASTKNKAVPKSKKHSTVAPKVSSRPHAVIKPFPPHTTLLESDDSDAADNPEEVPMIQDTTDEEEKYEPPPELEPNETKLRNIPEFIPVEVKPEDTKPEIKKSPEDIAMEIEAQLQELIVPMETPKHPQPSSSMQNIRNSLNAQLAKKKARPQEPQAPVPTVKSASSLELTPAKQRIKILSKKVHTSDSGINSTATTESQERLTSSPLNEPSKQPEPATPQTVPMVSSPVPQTVTTPSQIPVPPIPPLPSQLLQNLPTNQSFSIVPVVQGNQTFYIFNPIGAPPPMLPNMPSPVMGSPQNFNVNSNMGMPQFPQIQSVNNNMSQNQVTPMNPNMGIQQNQFNPMFPFQSPNGPWMPPFGQQMPPTSTPTADVPSAATVPTNVEPQVAVNLPSTNVDPKTVTSSPFIEPEVSKTVESPVENQVSEQIESQPIESQPELEESNVPSSVISTVPNDAQNVSNVDETTTQNDTQNDEASQADICDEDSNSSEVSTVKATSEDEDNSNEGDMEQTSPLPEVDKNATDMVATATASERDEDSPSTVVPHGDGEPLANQDESSSSEDEPPAPVVLPKLSGPGDFNKLTPEALKHLGLTFEGSIPPRGTKCPDPCILPSTPSDFVSTPNINNVLSDSIQTPSNIIKKPSTSKKTQHKNTADLAYRNSHCNNTKQGSFSRNSAKQVLKNVCPDEQIIKRQSFGRNAAKQALKKICLAVDTNSGDEEDPDDPDCVVDSDSSADSECVMIPEKSYENKVDSDIEVVPSLVCTIDSDVEIVPSSESFDGAPIVNIDTPVLVPDIANIPVVEPIVNTEQIQHALCVDIEPTHPRQNVNTHHRVSITTMFNSQLTELKGGVLTASPKRLIEPLNVSSTAISNNINIPVISPIKSVKSPDNTTQTSCTQEKSQNLSNNLQTQVISNQSQVSLNVVPSPKAVPVRSRKRNIETVFDDEEILNFAPATTNCVICHKSVLNSQLSKHPCFLPKHLHPVLNTETEDIVASLPSILKPATSNIEKEDNAMEITISQLFISSPTIPVLKDKELESSVPSITDVVTHNNESSAVTDIIPQEDLNTSNLQDNDLNPAIENVNKCTAPSLLSQENNVLSIAQEEISNVTSDESKQESEGMLHVNSSDANSNQETYHPTPATCQGEDNSVAVVVDLTSVRKGKSEEITAEINSIPCTQEKPADYIDDETLLNFSVPADIPEVPEPDIPEIDPEFFKEPELSSEDEKSEVDEDLIHIKNPTLECSKCNEVFHEHKAFVNHYAKHFYAATAVRTKSLKKKKKKIVKKKKVVRKTRSKSKLAGKNKSQETHLEGTDISSGVDKEIQDLLDVNLPKNMSVHPEAIAVSLNEFDKFLDDLEETENATVSEKNTSNAPEFEFFEIKSEAALSNILISEKDNPEETIESPCQMNLRSKNKRNVPVTKSTKKRKTSIKNAKVKKLISKKIKDVAANSDPQIKKFVCNFCNKSFAKKCVIESHILSHLNVRPFACTFCPKRFIQRSTCTEHIRIHTGERKFSCNLCDKSFTAKAGLAGHKVRHETKRYPCEKCDKTFISSHGAILHNRNVHINSRLFSCDICLVSFKTKAALKTHINSHNPKQQTVCEYCGLTFKTSRTRNSHVRNVHLGQIKCSYCSFVGRTKRTVEDHTLKHDREIFHSKMKQRLEHSQFPCVYCDLDFQSDRDRRAHGNEAHIKDLPFDCGYCSMRFQRETTANGHFKSHGKMKLIVCRICLETFSKHSDLKRHKLKTHIKSNDDTVNNDEVMEDEYVDLLMSNNTDKEKPESVDISILQSITTSCKNHIISSESHSCVIETNNTVTSIVDSSDLILPEVTVPKFENSSNELSTFIESKTPISDVDSKSTTVISSSDGTFKIPVELSNESSLLNKSTAQISPVTYNTDDEPTTIKISSEAMDTTATPCIELPTELKSLEAIEPPIELKFSEADVTSATELPTKTKSSEGKDAEVTTGSSFVVPPTEVQSSGAVEPPIELKSSEVDVTSATEPPTKTKSLEAENAEITTGTSFVVPPTEVKSSGAVEPPIELKSSEALNTNATFYAETSKEVEFSEAFEALIELKPLETAETSDTSYVETVSSVEVNSKIITPTASPQPSEVARCKLCKKEIINEDNHVCIRTRRASERLQSSPNAKKITTKEQFSPKSMRKLNSPSKSVKQSSSVDLESQISGLNNKELIDGKATSPASARISERLQSSPNVKKLKILDIKKDFSPSDKNLTSREASPNSKKLNTPTKKSTPSKKQTTESEDLKPRLRERTTTCDICFKIINVSEIDTHACVRATRAKKSLILDTKPCMKCKHVIPSNEFNKHKCKK